MSSTTSAPRTVPEQDEDVILPPLLYLIKSLTMTDPAVIIQGQALNTSGGTGQNDQPVRAAVAASGSTPTPVTTVVTEPAQGGPVGNPSTLEVVVTAGGKNPPHEDSGTPRKEDSESTEALEAEDQVAGLFGWCLLL